MQVIRKYSHIGFGLLLVSGVALAVALCVQCVRTYLYISAVLIPQQAEREAERQGGAVDAAARMSGATDPSALGRVLKRVVESGTDVLWMRLLDGQSSVLAQAGAPVGNATVPPTWWERVVKHESLGRIVETPAGKALVVMLPFRLPPPHAGPPHGAAPEGPPVWDLHRHAPHGRGAGGYVLEIAVPLGSVAGAFSGLRQNVVFGLFAAFALLFSVIFIAARTPKYLRGKYLERELELARRVQSDLQPKSLSVSPWLEFAAAAQAAGHVGGDFHDIFETTSGRIAIVLGDVSGKGIPAALLVSVLHGAIRSSSGAQHESTCERINRMLCERTASERFASLFWGVFDVGTSTLRYVNAGHPPPMLIRSHSNQTERLDEGGPVLGLLASAAYSVGIARIDAGDTLILYSDGINEAANAAEEEFGEKRIAEFASAATTGSPRELCDQLMAQVADFARSGSTPDDRTLMVIRFQCSAVAMTA